MRALLPPRRSTGSAAGGASGKWRTEEGGMGDPGGAQLTDAAEADEQVPVKVLLVDDHAAFRQPLAFMLARDAAIEVVAQAGSVIEAEAHLAEPDVAVIDLHLPDGDGTDIIRRLRSVNPHCRVLLLTASSGRDEMARAVEAGADGVLHKSASVTEVLGAIRTLGSGGSLLSQGEVIDLLRLAAQKRERDWGAVSALERLTPRERQVLELVAEGLSDKEIARRLSVSHETVRTHMVNILGKLGVDSRLQALLLAVRHNFIKID
jgi:RNA polymerase sigma factor (sigma-70 family)